MTCKHESTTDGQIYGYNGSVAHHPFTYENPRAHGGVRYTETCDACGAKRLVNSNGLHYEYGTWGPSLAEREREERERQRQQEIADFEAAADRVKALQRGAVSYASDDGRRWYVAEVDKEGVVIRTEPEPRHVRVTWEYLDLAADQPEPLLRTAYSAIRADARLLRRFKP
jgi:hypothetical protein